ncbi:MAG: hypothetical protein LZ173_05990 [Thaumarchaeota archaeon]|jgi:hypothetical protein|nr:hypothetical protein [Candidatus Geocrenenecus arthurdayi]
MKMEPAVLRHYLREEVQVEVARFCRGRWVALEARPIHGKRVFYRYFDEKPLTINEPVDVKKMINRFTDKRIRTIYGTINIYNRISSKEDLERMENISRTTPSIDIDGSLEEVDLTIETVKTILEELHRHGVEKSVYLVWSGRGVHIHLNEKAISESYWRPDPVKTAHTIIEYILKQVRGKLLEIAAKSKSYEEKLKIENIIDVQRVFTSPLSIHRELDIVTVTIDPDEIENFNLEWTELDRFRYWRDWDRYIEGELDGLVEEAMKEVRVESITRTIIGEELREDESPEVGLASQPLSIGRFQVMALMQAARYYVLRGDIEQAKSFGLNRAIFYAWAKKRGVTRRRQPSKLLLSREQKISELEDVVGDEVVYRSPGGWYMIGGQEQTPRDFDMQIVQRFGGQEIFQRYWEAALRYIHRFPLETVKSQREFYEKIYLPVRDNLDKILRGQ